MQRPNLAIAMLTAFASNMMPNISGYTPEAAGFTPNRGGKMRRRTRNVEGYKPGKLRPKFVRQYKGQSQHVLTELQTEGRARKLFGHGKQARAEARRFAS